MVLAHTDELSTKTQQICGPLNDTRLIPLLKYMLVIHWVRNAYFKHLLIAKGHHIY